MTIERRLDDAVAALGAARLRLDEITRARVGARLEAQLAQAELVAPSTPGAPRRRWHRVALAAGALLAAAAAIVLVTRARLRPDDGPAETTLVPLPGTSIRVDVAAGESRRLVLDDTVVTVFGPGHFDGGGARATADAAALVVDRPRGDGPWTLHYDGIEVIATRATFALDRGMVVRVTVMRGEVTLRCGDVPQLVQAGESAGCDDQTAAASPPTRAPMILPTLEAAAGVVVEPVVAPALAAAVPSGHPSPPATLLVRPSARPTPGPVPSPDAAHEPAPLAEAPAAEPPLAEPPVPLELEASAAAPDLYVLAEGAMLRGDGAGARAALEAVIAAHPTSLDAALALLDLANLADRDGDARSAHAFLDRLDAHPRRAAIAAPAARLRATLGRR